jgi:uncharacterized protein YggE
MRAATLFAVALTLAAAPAFAAGKITVTGTGSVSAAPDMATLTLGVTTEGAEAAAAMAANSEAMAAVIARLAGLGIAERDMQTSSISLSPRWEPPREGETEPRTNGFVASNMLTVEVRDLAALGGVIDAVVGDGANTLGGLVFGIADDKAATDEARRAAVSDARARAEVLAAAAGVTLGPVAEIIEGGVMGGPMFARMEMATAGAPPVAPGEIDLQVSVTMSWEIAE